MRWSAAAYARYAQASSHPAFNTDPADAVDGESSSRSADYVNNLDLSFDKDSNSTEPGMSEPDTSSAEVYEPDEEEEDGEND